MTEPKAAQKLHTFTHFGIERIDPYFWMNQRDSKVVLDYLKSENRYTETGLASTKPLQKTIFKEIKGRIPQEDESLPVKLSGNFYFKKFLPGQEHPIIYTMPTLADKKMAKVLLDVNKWAKDKPYCQLNNFEISSNGQYFAFSIDFSGRRQYETRILNIKTGQLLPEVLDNTSGQMAFNTESTMLFYIKKDKKTLREYKVIAHHLGKDKKEDTCIFEEKDDTFYCGIGTTKSKKYIVIEAQSTTTSEAYFFSASSNGKNICSFLPRKKGHEYSIEHGDKWYIRSNKTGENFALFAINNPKNQKEKWQEIQEHNPDALLEDFDVFNSFYVVQHKQNGLDVVRAFSLNHTLLGTPTFPEPVYTAQIGFEPDFYAKYFRLTYTSMVQPIAQYFVQTDGSKTLKKQQQIPDKSFKAENYTSKRLLLPSHDGTKVPVSFVYKKDLYKTGKNPLLLYGYGSYGISMPVSFSVSRLSLLDRGFVFAIAHIRGGEDLGRKWYLDGKLLNKKNTFLDFLACAKHLGEKDIVDKNAIYAMGGSAGGMLMGAISNMQPKLFKGIVAQVPFVDVITTMLDDSIPLTTGEYDEWGNPNRKEFFKYMLSYSPYDNVIAQNYPHMLITTGYHDSQVQYWEPAKWIAKLRAKRTNQNHLYFKCDLSSGHSGKAGRFEGFKETALEYAFLCMLENIAH